MFKTKSSLKILEGKMNKARKKINQSFKHDIKELTVGIETEMYLMVGKDPHKRTLCDNEDVMNNILSELPDQVTRDYYPYQIELRTDPHDNPKDLLEEFKEIIKKSTKVCANYNCSIVPMSWLGGGEMYNGMHIHLRYKQTNYFYNTMMNTYPYILALADLSKNSPLSVPMLSRRMDQSPHMKIPPLTQSGFASCGLGNSRYYDVIINKHRENNRHRKKFINTLEIRMFDVPTDFKYYEFFIKIIFEIYTHLKNKQKNLFGLPNLEAYQHIATKTREESILCRYPLNYFFESIPQRTVLELLCDKFGLDTISDPYPIINNVTSTDQIYNRFGWRSLDTLFPFIKNTKFSIKKAKHMTAKEVLERLGPVSPSAQEYERRDRNPENRMEEADGSTDGREYESIGSEDGGVARLGEPSEVSFTNPVDFDRRRSLELDSRLILGPLSGGNNQIKFKNPRFILIRKDSFVNCFGGPHSVGLTFEKTEVILSHSTPTRVEEFYKIRKVIVTPSIIDSDILLRDLKRNEFRRPYNNIEDGPERTAIRNITAPNAEPDTPLVNEDHFPIPDEVVRRYHGSDTTNMDNSE